MYPSEFRARMVELIRSGRNPEELSREFEPTAQAIRNWVAQSDWDEGRRRGGVTTVELEEFSRLRRESKKLRQEREIPASAAAWFAQGTELAQWFSRSWRLNRLPIRLPRRAVSWASIPAGATRGSSDRLRNVSGPVLAFPNRAKQGSDGLGVHHQSRIARGTWDRALALERPSWGTIVFLIPFIFAKIRRMIGV